MSVKVGKDAIHSLNALRDYSRASIMLGEFVEKSCLFLHFLCVRIETDQL